MLARTTTLLLALGAVASAQTLKGFPSSITCLKDDGTNGDVSQAEIESSVVGPQGDITEESAANTASGHCTSLSGIPLYYVSYPLQQCRILWVLCYWYANSFINHLRPLLGILQVSAMPMTRPRIPTPSVWLRVLLTRKLGIQACVPKISLGQ